MDFLDLFSNGKCGGLGPRRVDWVAWLRSMVDRGDTAMPYWRVARGHECSLGLTGDGVGG
jgi:hypothetical protein